MTVDDPPPPPGQHGDVGAPPTAPEEEGLTQEQADVQKVYALRDGIMKGATDLGVETKGGLLELFVKDAVAHPDVEGGQVLARSQCVSLLVELGIDAAEPSVAWIISHFILGSEKNGPIDVRAMLNYLQLTPEAEEQTILATLHDKLRDGAEALGIATKEELCALVTTLEDCLGENLVIDPSKLAEAAKNLSEAAVNGTPDGSAESMDPGRFWAALGFIDSELRGDAESSQGGIATLVEQVYTHEDGRIDAVHLLHDVRLWPGVEESERWEELAEELRSRLCEGAHKVGIRTKEGLCQLFADEEGRPRKMTIADFSAVCREKLDTEILLSNDSDSEDEDEDDDDSDLAAFIRLCAVDPPQTEEDESTVDVGELLWKLLIWPGSEEESRSLNAGRGLRQDLLASAEEQRLETVGDLYTRLVECCHEDSLPSLKKEAGVTLVDDSSLQVVPIARLLAVLRDSFGVTDDTPGSDLGMYLSHFPPPPKDEEEEEEEEDEDGVDKRKVDLKRLLQHLELFDDDEDDEEEEDDEDDVETVDGNEKEVDGDSELDALVNRAQNQ